MHGDILPNMLEIPILNIFGMYILYAHIHIQTGLDIIDRHMAPLESSIGLFHGVPKCWIFGWKPSFLHTGSLFLIALLFFQLPD